MGKQARKSGAKMVTLTRLIMPKLRRSGIMPPLPTTATL